MQYYAHISDDKARRQTVKEHLTGTARRSELFAEAFRCGAWGYGCGILHDIGKYSQGFRKRLEGGSITDHATAGAQEMMGLPGPTRWLLIAPLTVSAATIRDFWTEEGTATRQGRPRFREGLRSN